MLLQLEWRALKLTGKIVHLQYKVDLNVEEAQYFIDSCARSGYGTAVVQ
jgi:hypothetical protein